MDRFEGNSALILQLIIRDLHSSMDRFEAQKNLLTWEQMTNLHSSMDRFEAEIIAKSLNIEKFTFQYG